MHLNSVTRTNPKASAFRSRNDRIGCRATSGNSHTPAAAHTKFIANTDFVEDSGCECVEISDKLHGRRSILMGAVACAAAPALLSTNAEAKTGSSRAAGDFCPPAATDGYVLYTPAKDATPSLRAGVIQPSPDLYSFELPPSWNEGTILNILSGNFCMPRCDEPWYETLWESSDQGSATLIVSPLYRLISKSSATLKDLGTPEQVSYFFFETMTLNIFDPTLHRTSISITIEFQLR